MSFKRAGRRALNPEVGDRGPPWHPKIVALKCREYARGIEDPEGSVQLRMGPPKLYLRGEIGVAPVSYTGIMQVRILSEIPNIGSLVHDRKNIALSRRR